MKSTNLLSRTCIAMVLTMLATTAIAQTQAIHTLKMTDGTVNQNYNTDALIDMQSTSKGLLLPRVELTGTTAAAPLANHTAGMVVYNTVSAGSGGTAVSPGYYYNDGTQWVKIGSAAAISAWGQYGNTGTSATANWIGTNDVADFVTKTNGAERLRVTSGGKLLVGTATSLTGGANAIMQINNGTTNGALQIVDGTQGAGKVLTSDANGLATWTDGSGIAWTLKGNTGITANNAAYGSSLTAGTGNWLGTINSADLILAANNKEGLRVNTAQQVLIGTTTVPTGGTTAKVIINNGTTAGALQIKDGTEGANKVLTSDANGVAKWVTSAATLAAKITLYVPSPNTNSTPLTGTFTEATLGNISFSCVTVMVNGLNVNTTGTTNAFSNYGQIGGSTTFNVTYTFNDIGFLPLGFIPYGNLTTLTGAPDNFYLSCVSITNTTLVLRVTRLDAVDRPTAAFNCYGIILK